MKKAISLLLALVLCLSLCACGGNTEKETPTETSAPEQTTQPTQAETEPTVPEAKDLILGETYSFGDYDITITNFDFTAKAENPEKGKGGNLIPSSGKTVANIYFNVKYNGKSAISYPSFFCQVVYGDGYTFNSERVWYYANDVDAWLNVGKIEPLTPEFGNVVSFFVPEEVRDNQENTLSVFFYNSGTEPFAVYKVR